jgi:hypothetical protein
MRAEHLQPTSSCFGGNEHAAGARADFNFLAAMASRVLPDRSQMVERATSVMTRNQWIASEIGGVRTAPRKRDFYHGGIHIRGGATKCHKNT